MIEDKAVHLFLDKIKNIKSQIRIIYLFGSRAKDNFRPDSDYDLLLVLKKRDRNTIDKLYDSVMDVLMLTGRLISLKIFKESDFNRLSKIPTLFMERVLKEGIIIG